MTRGLAAAFLLLSAAAAAQEGRPEGEPPRRPREEIFRMIDAYVADRLQASLGLSKEEIDRLLPLVRKLHSDRRRFAERRIRAIHQMRELMTAGMARDPRIAELLQEVKAVEAEEPAAIRAGHDAIDAVLTPLQQAQFRVFEAEIEHRMRRAMARVRGERHDGPGRPQREDAPRQRPDPR